MKDLKNPFLLTGFYHKRYFCDRNKEIEELKYHIDNERNVVLYSWRRMGKTALLKYLHTTLETGKRTETVYVDLLGTRDTDAAIKRIIQAVYDRFGKISSGFSSSFLQLIGRIGVEFSFDSYSGSPTFTIGMRNNRSAIDSLQAIGDFLDKRKNQVVITLDEFQQIANYSESNGESLFRSWMQSFPALRFIYSGSHRHMMVSMFTEKNRPFYRSTQLMQLGPIDKDQYRSFISNHFRSGGKSIEDSITDAIFSWSRMQTYCIQLICNKLYAKCSQVQPEDIQEVLDEIIDQESVLFSNYTRLLTHMQWKVLVAVANEEPLSNPLSKEFIQKYQLGAASSVSNALNKLQVSELVFEDEGSYFIHDVLLLRWLQSL